MLKLGEDVKKALGDDVVGAVVVGEGDLVWFAGGDENFAEDLRLRRQCGVGAKRDEACSGESCGRRRDVVCSLPRVQV